MKHSAWYERICFCNQDRTLFKEAHPKNGTIHVWFFERLDKNGPKDKKQWMCGMKLNAAYLISTQNQIQLEIAAHDCWLRPRVSRAPGAIGGSRLLASATREPRAQGDCWLTIAGFGHAWATRPRRLLAHDCWLRPRVSHAPKTIVGSLIFASNSNWYSQCLCSKQLFV